MSNSDALNEIVEVILGLDVSTSITGWSIVRADAKVGDKPVMMGSFKMQKLNGFWVKADWIKNEIDSLVKRVLIGGYRIVGLAVEDPAKKFQRGRSSAGTIALLLRFNVIVSHFARDALKKIDPLYIDATEARKTIGMILLSKKKSGGKSQKEQTFEQLSETVFKGTVWPITKTGNIKSYCFDEVDAYVIAMAGSIAYQS